MEDGWQRLNTIEPAFQINQDFKKSPCLFWDKNPCIFPALISFKMSFIGEWIASTRQPFSTQISNSKSP